jgi:hypothetical protein
MFHLRLSFFPFHSVRLSSIQFVTIHVHAPKRASSLPKKKKETANLVSLVLLNLLPKAGVLLDADLLGGVELVEAAQVHVLGEQRDHVLVKGLPVRVLEVVPMEESEFVAFCTGWCVFVLRKWMGTHFWLPSFS